MTMQPNEELASIRNLVEQTHFSALANGHYFVIWGLTISIGFAYNELQFTWNLPLSPLWVWIAAVATGWFYTVRTMARERRQSRIQTQFGRLLASEWITNGMAMTVVFFVGGQAGAISAQAIPGLTAAFLAIAFKATAELSGIRWLTYVAALWLVSAAGLFLLPPEMSAAALAVCLLALMVAPGLVLQSRARKLAQRTS
jgi:hypothetical protein